MTLISDCCGMPAGGFFDVGICPDCREHCEWIDDEESDDSLEPNNPKESNGRSQTHEIPDANR